MRTLLKSILFASVVALTGCEKKEVFLRTNPSAIEVAADELTAGLLVEATASWMASRQDGVDWLGFRYDGDALWITIAEANENPEPRTAAITIISGDGLSIDVPVTQLGTPEEPEEPESESEE